MRTVSVVIEISIIYFAATYITYSLSTNRNYFGLISNVHNYFSTSCVFVVRQKNDNLKDLDRIEGILRQFSAQSVFAVSIEFRQLNETIRFYSKRVVRALFVVSLRSHQVVAEFSNLTNYFDMTASCWLLLFDETIYLETLPTIKLRENIFHLTFNTEMFVARHNQSTIQEWYWLRNRVKMEDVATWDFDMGFTLITADSLYERRANLENSTIVVTTLHNPPMISFINNSVGGLFGAIFTELSAVANFNVKYLVPRENVYGSWNAEENRWTGMIELLVSGEASIAAAEFTISTSRLEAVDFSLPLISTRDKLYIRQPDSRIHWSAYWQAFDSGIWILIQVMILFSTLILTLITSVRGRKITFHVFSGYLLDVLGVYCQQGLPEFPTDLPSQIAYFSLFLSALIVSAAYSAALISFLTITGVALPFSTLTEFVDDTNFDLIVFRDGAEYDLFVSATESLMMKMKSKLKPRAELPETLADGFNQVCNEKVAFYIPAAMEETIRLHLPCKVVGIDTSRSMSLAMALSKGNPYNGLINYHVQRFRDLGILNRLKHDYTAAVVPTTTVHAEVTLWGVIPILAVLGGGMVLAILIICLEKFCFFQRSRASVKDKRKERHGRGSCRSEEMVKNRLPHRAKHLTPSQIFALEKSWASRDFRDN